MWSRKQLLKDHCAERNRPVRWSRSPIKLRTQYEHVYLMTRSRIGKSFFYIMKEESQIREMRKEARRRVYALDGADIFEDDNMEQMDLWLMKLRETTMKKIGGLWAFQRILFVPRIV